MLSVKDVATLLRKSGADPIFTNRAYDELLFTGIANRRDDILIVANRVYCDIARLHLVNVAADADETSLWASIEEVELGLRRLIRHCFTQHWGSRADDKLGKASGPQVWSGIMGRHTKQQALYPSTEPIQH